jgi:hypothetical protein
MMMTAALLMLAAPLGMASDYHRDSIGPGGVYVDEVANLAATTCNDTTGSIEPTLLCGSGGVGAIIALDGSAGEKDLSAEAKVSGDCSVTLDAAIAGLNGNFSFICGVDRDDDFSVTNADADTTNPRGFDDDFVEGNGSAAVSVCFRADLEDSFDDAWVIIAANVPSTSAAAGTFSIDLNLSADSSCNPSDGTEEPSYCPDP